MSKPYYVTLTGCRNNAGDFLIRHRGHALLRNLRADRTIVDRNAWEPFDEERLREVNGAAALILLGGPALRRDMYPTVYPLVPDVARIEVPIAIMGAGWHARPGSWEDSRTYRFTPATLRLLQRVAKGAAGISVRDYRSLNALQHAGIPNAVMTGCPALYATDELGRPLRELPPGGPTDIVFSFGVGFIHSPALEAQAKELLLSLRLSYPRARLTVAFHHSLDFASLAEAYGDGRQELSAERHGAVVEWLKSNGVEYQDISGGVDKLLDLYGRADFHVGYRVHAHICMSSLRKPSVLLTEDGRGKALKEVLGGVIFDSWKNRAISAKERLLARLGRSIGDRQLAYTGIGKDVDGAVDYERRNGYPRFDQPLGRIDQNYATMKRFVESLP